MIRAFLIACGLLAATAADARQVLSNPSFTSWPHGSPVRGSYGSGSDTAAHWISKWNDGRGSSAVASRLSPQGGLRYTLRPDPSMQWGYPKNLGATFYLRQHVKHPSPGNYRAVIVLASRSPEVRGGFYIYQGDHLHVVNKVASLPMPKNQWRTFWMPYHLPGGSSADLLVAFLFTTPHPATVDIRSFYMSTIP